MDSLFVDRDGIPMVFYMAPTKANVDKKYSKPQLRKVIESHGGRLVGKQTNEALKLVGPNSGVSGTSIDYVYRCIEQGELLSPELFLYDPASTANDKPKRVEWTPKEDEACIQYVRMYGSKDYLSGSKIPSRVWLETMCRMLGTQRCNHNVESVKMRFRNTLQFRLRNGKFSKLQPSDLEQPGAPTVSAEVDPIENIDDDDDDDTSNVANDVPPQPRRSTRVVEAVTDPDIPTTVANKKSLSPARETRSTRSSKTQMVKRTEVASPASKTRSAKSKSTTSQAKVQLRSTKQDSPGSDDSDLDDVDEIDKQIMALENPLPKNPKATSASSASTPPQRRGRSAKRAHSQQTALVAKRTRSSAKTSEIPDAGSSSSVSSAPTKAQKATPMTSAPEQASHTGTEVAGQRENKETLDEDEDMVDINSSTLSDDINATRNAVTWIKHETGRSAFEVIRALYNSSGSVADALKWLVDPNSVKLCSPHHDRWINDASEDSIKQFEARYGKQMLVRRVEWNNS